MVKQSNGQTSRLLISEPPLLVLPSLAVLVGLNEALFLQQLHYWLLQSGKERDGRRWIYNTYDEWHGQLPFWSVRTIRRIVGELEGKDLVLSTTSYNAQKVDQTKWYTLDYAELDRLTDRADQVDNVATWPVQEAADQLANLAASVPETTSETLLREREVEDSNLREAHRSIVDKYDGDRLTLLPYAEDLAREMNDQAPLTSTTTRLVNLYKRSDLGMDEFVNTLMAARAITKERTASIKTPPPGGGSWGPKPKLGYLFAVLEDLVGDPKGRKTG